MSPCTGAVERSFSLQKSVHSLVRNRLTHDRVAKLMFVHTNLNLIGDVGLRGEDLDFNRSVTDLGESGEDASASETGDLEGASL